MGAGREIWIIDDHQLFSAGLKQMLETVAEHYDIQCFNEPALAEMLDAERQLALIIMDFYIPGADTLESIARFRGLYPATPLVVISSSTSPSDKRHSLEAGAAAYYPKHAPPEVTLEKLRQFIDRGSVNDADGPSQGLEHGLTDRQADILIHIARGHSNKKIAQLLDISPETVKSHLATIYRQIHCDSRDQAVEWARSKGLV